MRERWTAMSGSRSGGGAEAGLRPAPTRARERQKWQIYFNGLPERDGRDLHNGRPSAAKKSPAPSRFASIAATSADQRTPVAPCAPPPPKPRLWALGTQNLSPGRSRG